MTKTVFALALSVLACSAVAETGTPTLADAPQSVLTTQVQPQQAAPPAQEQAAAPVQKQAAPCCETAKEVRLGPWQARRLARQAERQEVRECCECDCPRPKCKCRTTVLVVTKTAPKCPCDCR